MKEPKARGIRQTMSDLHIWIGLLLGWVLYAMFLTGTLAFFKDEISQWMRPELPHQREVPDAAIVAQRVADEMARIAPGTPQWSARLPDERNNSVSVFWRTSRGQPERRTFDDAYLDPTTGKKVAARDTLGGDFLVRFHFQFHYMPPLWGRWIAGVAAMFMLIAIVSGVFTHKKIFIDFFTFRWGKGQRSWLDAHNALSVFGLPFHAMITYTGLVTLMAMYMPWGQQAVIKTPAERQQLQAQLSNFIQPGKASGQAASLAPVDAMVRQAQALWGPAGVKQVTVTHAGDAASRVAVGRAEANRVSNSPQYMLFEGSTGRLLETRDSVGPAAETRGVLYALHLGRFSDLSLRWLYFIVSLAGTAMVGTGLVMWTVKRRAKLPDPDKPYFGFWLVERLNIATIGGLSIAIAAYFWANRLLPLEGPMRSEHEILAFFIAWAVAAVHALLRPARRAWIEQLWAGCAALALLPVLDAFFTERPPWQSLARGDGVFAGIDLMLWVLAAMHGWLALRTMRHGRRVAVESQARVRETASTAREREALQ